MKQDQVNKRLPFSARADYLARGGLLERKRISETEYIERLNGIRVDFGLPPLTVEPKKPRRDKRIDEAIRISLERDTTATELAESVGLSEPSLFQTAGNRSLENVSMADLLDSAQCFLSLQAIAKSGGVDIRYRYRKWRRFNSFRSQDHFRSKRRISSKTAFNSRIRRSVNSRNSGASWATLAGWFCAAKGPRKNN